MIALASVVSIIAAGLTFFAIWVFWLRSLVGRLGRMERVLKEIHRSLTKHHEKLSYIEELLKAARDEGGRWVQLYVVEIDPNLSYEERERLIRYLRAEGFIP